MLSSDVKISWDTTGLEFKEVLGLVVSFLIWALSIWVLIALFIPLSLTKETQIKKEELTVVQVEGKLLSSDGLTVFLKDSKGDYSEKIITVYSETKIKENGSRYLYTKINTKVIYHTKQKLLELTKGRPKNQSKTEMILTVPKGSLTQKQ